MFEIPIVLFIFKRPEKTVQIIKHISIIQPRKIYLIGDGPRNDDEKQNVFSCRKAVEKVIPKDCELIKNYANVNRGVYENIAGGAKWVFEKEKWAIFLEDDNFPELSFFPFCEEMLHKYEHDSRILWVCGTNYLKEYNFPDGATYGFTQNMMPCGWASWSSKFLKYYEGDLEKWKYPSVKNGIKSLSYYRLLKKQDMSNWDMELRHLNHFGRFASWDYQMSFTLRIHNLFGIVPAYNQIKNIGVDENSIHGGTSYKNEMTSRFCGLPTKQISFPLIHPKTIIPDKKFEIRVSKIITLPFALRLRVKINKFIKGILKIDEFTSLSSIVRNLYRRK
ncbi:MAG: glycosyltransferase family 2 protein [Bacteroides sp.]|nr:glycosyltransferase family 2 protein [Bacteroides sp.]